MSRIVRLGHRRRSATIAGTSGRCLAVMRGNGRLRARSEVHGTTGVHCRVVPSWRCPYSFPCTGGALRARSIPGPSRVPGSPWSVATLLCGGWSARCSGGASEHNAGRVVPAIDESSARALEVLDGGVARFFAVVVPVIMRTSISFHHRHTVRRGLVVSG